MEEKLKKLIQQYVPANKVAEALSKLEDILDEGSSESFIEEDTTHPDPKPPRP